MVEGQLEVGDIIVYVPRGDVDGNVMWTGMVCATRPCWYGPSGPRQVLVEMVSRAETKLDSPDINGWYDGNQFKAIGSLNEVLSLEEFEMWKSEMAKKAQTMVLA